MTDLNEIINSLKAFLILSGYKEPQDNCFVMDFNILVFVEDHINFYGYEAPLTSSEYTVTRALFNTLPNNKLIYTNILRLDSDTTVDMLMQEFNYCNKHRQQIHQVHTHNAHI